MVRSRAQRGVSNHGGWSHPSRRGEVAALQDEVGLVAHFHEDEARIAAMSCRGLTVDWEDNGCIRSALVDSRAVIRAIAGQGKSFPQNISRDWG
jgi:hypothetical protein